MKEWLLVFLVPITLVAIAAVRSGAGFSGVLSGFREQPLYFSVQLFMALLGVILIAWTLSVAGSIVRWLVRRLYGIPAERFRLGLAAEGIIAGLLFIGLALGRTSPKSYVSPDSACRIEIRRLSWIEAPFGQGLGSFWFVPLSITYRDNQGRFIVEEASEYESDYPGDSACNRTVLWSTNGSLRAIVGFSVLDNWYYFPDPVEGSFSQPPDQALAAYLRGEPVEVVNRMIWESQAKPNIPD